MIAFITVVILIACVILAFFILVQNPKGGGLSGTFGSMSTQVMGVKQSTDIMEKGTWVMISIIAVLCLIAVMFYEKPKNNMQQQSAPAKTEQPAQQKPAQ
jgi:preprotein translocase subunit SecG